mgnify:CR=1 FL=1
MSTDNQIEITASEKNYTIFKTTCACNGDEHQMYVDIEVEDVCKCSEEETEKGCAPLIEMTLIFRQHTNMDEFRFYNNWFGKMWNRIKIIFNILIDNDVDLEDCFIFRDTDHIQGFIEQLQKGMDKMKWTQKEIDEAERKAKIIAEKLNWK